jgi:pyruvate dehydrogenase E2 component (dihydrolipoamide acetyltransferase)
MISEVIIPDLGATGGDVVLEEWLVEPGETVTTGQALFLVTTDKATVEVESFRDGVVRELKAEVGEHIAPGTVVALLADKFNEPLSSSLADHSKAEYEAKQPIPNSPMVEKSYSGKSNRRILASPLARKIAEKENIDLASLSGTGTRGQILKRDVLAVIDSQESAPKTSLQTPGVQRQSLSPMRRSIADRTWKSKNEIPHFYTSITIDMQSAISVRRQAVDWAAQQGWSDPTITDLCIKTAALALVEYPGLNASLDGETINTLPEVNIGLVVGLEEGMLVPVIHGANHLDLFTLSAITRQLKARAVSGQLNADQLSNATFTLSNLGMFGVDSFTAVINPPQAGILALGAVKEQPAAVDGQVVLRHLMIATLSVDHRIVDGILAARFLETFKDMLEKPFTLFLDSPMEAQP